MNSMNLLIITFLIHLLKRVSSDETPIEPRNDSFFEIKSWTGLLKGESGNQTDHFAQLFELTNGGGKKLIGEVVQNGHLYNDREEVSLCKRHVFLIKANERESEPLVWTPRSYHNVMPIFLY